MKQEIYQIDLWVEELIKSHPIILTKIGAIPELNSIHPELILKEVLRFLFLVSSQRQILTPSKLVDLAWHEFILFTKLYHHFCSDKLGRFIHHTPDENVKSNQRNFLKTIQCYITVFGEPNPEIWGHLAQQEWNDSQCGSCETN